MSGTGGWKKSPNGSGWIPSAAPPIPPRPQPQVRGRSNAVIAPPPVQGRGRSNASAGIAPPQKPLSALTQEFARNALTFMRQNVVTPANGNLRDGRVVTQWALDPRDITMDPGLTSYQGAAYNVDPATGARGPALGELRDVGRSIKHMRLAKVGDKVAGNAVVGQAGAILPILANSADEHETQSIPIWWLPWDSLKIGQIQIPEVPSNLVDPPEDEYPRFWLTAGVNGCSVFAKGESTNPTIYHAGLSDKLTRGSTAFWRDQMRLAGTGFDSNSRGVHGEVHKDEYMLNDPREKKLAQDFVTWLHGSELSQNFAVELHTGFGCLFGIRFGRHWSLYLQENIYVQTVNFHKRRDVEKVVGDSSTYYTLASTGERVERVQTPTPRKIGIISVGKKNVNTYKTTKTLIYPTRVVEFYPNRHWTGAFIPKVVPALA